MRYLIFFFSSTLSDYDRGSLDTHGFCLISVNIVLVWKDPQSCCSSDSYTKEPVNDFSLLQSPGNLCNKGCDERNSILGFMKEFIIHNILRFSFSISGEFR